MNQSMNPGNQYLINRLIHSLIHSSMIDYLVLSNTPHKGLL